MKTIRIAGIVEESIVDGPGIRYVVFTQGCNHNCKGCHNPESHSFTGGKIVKIKDLVKNIIDNPLLKGVTLSGGEPFEQVDACISLIDEVKKYNDRLDFLAYSGYYIEEILKDKEKSRLLNKLDYLVDGPYIEEESSQLLKFRGSKNQNFIDLKEYFKKDF